MKKVLAISFVLIVCMAVSAFGAADNWRFYVHTDDGTGSNYGLDAHIGIAPTGVDGVDVNDAAADYAKYADTIVWAASEIAAEPTITYTKNLKEYSASGKSWTVRVAANINYGIDPELNTFRMYFKSTSGTTVLPPGAPWTYKLTMVNNQDVVGMPSEGTVWTIAPPVAGSTTFFTLENLPVKRLALTHTSMLSGGYEFRFDQLIPEPSSLLALGTGLVGLVGLVVRRRRS